MIDYPIRLSAHAAMRALQRGTDLREIEACIRQSISLPLEQGRRSSRLSFPFDQTSPVNGKHYKFKTIEAIYVEEDYEIVVITVKVYYSNEEVKS